jgi:hypothetical protein
MSNDLPNNYLYEVVTGQVVLGKKEKFFELHNGLLLPMMKEVGIHPFLLLLTEIGRYGRFLDIYVYNDYHDYESKTSKLLEHPKLKGYYESVSECVDGSIIIELMSELPYAKKWI